MNNADNDNDNASAAFIAIWNALEPTSRQKTIEELLDRQQEAAVVHDHGLILYANCTLARLFRAASPEALRGCDIADLAAEGARGLTREYVARICDEGRWCRALWPAQDGGQFVAEVEPRPVTWRGSPARLLLVRKLPT